ncbi:MAG: hypothetical protein CMM58_14540 [Rhodospirillaceae bacterium]|nr:hypothetical protein [Rhodospirillaceae bacterium]|tara:strand:+ start:925 stop:2748 length:1824 start_codon:yes stop_codon:yes gene_type:complete
MGNIAGFFTKNNMPSPILNSDTVAKLVGTKKPTLKSNFLAATKTDIVERGPLIIAMNGHLYNPEEFQTEQPSYSDACRILLSIKQFGLETTLRKINGDFCIAIMDKRSNSLTLARDRLGLQSLFYTQVQGVVAFASRARLLLTFPGVSSEFDNKFLKSAAATNYRFLDCEADRSPFQNIKQVPAGHIIQFTNEKMRTSLFSQSIGEIEDSTFQKNQYEEYMFLFSDSIERRLKNAEKTIFTLSGGLDSSAIVSMASRIKAQKQPAISTIHQDKLYDEQHEILDIVNSGIVDWKSISVDEPDIFALLTDIYVSHDYPLPTATWLNHFIISKKASDLGYQTIATGLGGDELHAGEYDYFFYFFADLQTSGKTELLNHEINAWAHNHNHPIFQKSYDIAIEGISNLTDPQNPGRCLPNIALLNRYKDLLSPELGHLDELAPEYHISASSYLTSHSHNELLLNTMPCCIRSSRENCHVSGMQEIHPFLDTRLWDFMMKIPGEAKIQNGVTKAFARKCYKELLPKATRTRIQKAGWNAPAHKWFSSSNREPLLDMISSRRFIERGIYNSKEVARIVDEHFSILSNDICRENHMMIIWQIVSLELWLRALELQ